jgi:flagellar biosynthesis/type III secretory pathway protein FliH
LLNRGVFWYKPAIWQIALHRIISADLLILRKGRKQGRQSGLQEGLQQGLQQGLLTIVQQQLARRFGKLSLTIRRQIERLTVAQLEE